MASGASGRVANVVRTVIWIVISSVFLWNSWYGIAAIRRHGGTPRPLAWVVLAVWALALGFWLSMGWRDWTRRIR